MALHATMHRKTTEHNFMYQMYRYSQYDWPHFWVQKHHNISKWVWRQYKFGIKYVNNSLNELTRRIQKTSMNPIKWIECIDRWWKSLITSVLLVLFISWKVFLCVLTYVYFQIMIKLFFHQKYYFLEFSLLELFLHTFRLLFISFCKSFSCVFMLYYFLT